MKTVACLVILGVIGCAGDVDDDAFPVLPGGGSPGAAGGGGGGTTTVLRGRVCVRTDLRDRSACVTTGTAGLAVAAGGAVAITAADGTFTIDVPRVPDLAFMVSGPGVVATASTFTPPVIVAVPVIDADVFARELVSNAVTLGDRTGTILGTVVRGDVAVRGIAVTTTPVARFGPFFDAGDTFGLEATGVRGVFFVPGLTTGATSLTFRDVVAGRETIVNGVQVVNGGITILDSVALP